MSPTARTDATLLEGGSPPVRDGFVVLEPGGPAGPDDDVVRLHYVEAGEGPLVVLLHGFPELWYAWRHVLPRLARAGFRVVAPDLRGFNLSDKPPRVAAYGAGVVARDVALLIAALGYDRAHVVGHDLGAGIAWLTAMTYPERVERLAVLNGPHPRRLARAFRDPRQLLRSWYVFLFQVPRLAEAIVRRRDFALLLNSFRDARVVPGAFSEEDLAHYADAYRVPGALTGMLGHYRALTRPSLAPRLAPVAAPTLVLWGERDPYLGRDLAQPPAEEVPDARVVYLPDATHWLHHEEPERVSALLADFLHGRAVG